MNRLMNGIYMRRLTKVANLLYLSLLWTVFSLPIITIGASTAALYYAAHYAIREEEGYIFQQFWKAMKSSFNQATITWIFFVAAISVFYYNSLFLGAQANGSVVSIIGQTIFLLLIPLACCCFIYAISYIARFQSPLKIVWKNAAILAISHLPKSLFLLTLLVLFIFSIWLLPILVVIIPAFFSYMISRYMENIFSSYLKEK
ncbi:YesL family protein [Niallia circulans]|uniref:YesL family protein n=1 Tax=Niallia circulans TaxID=1397 RepID=UPI00203C89AE|nr:YesL family protein [Niallia circulans]MCM2981818.1 YesL family protein [Niallia circulans]